jgi:hypothetical protein
MAEIMQKAALQKQKPKNNNPTKEGKEWSPEEYDVLVDKLFVPALALTHTTYSTI